MERRNYIRNRGIGGKKWRNYGKKYGEIIEKYREIIEKTREMRLYILMANKELDTGILGESLD